MPLKRSNLRSVGYGLSIYFGILVGFSAHAAMPVQQLSNAGSNAAQPIPSQVGSCIVPVGLSEECTRALSADCQQLSQCNGDSDCMTNRPRVDTSACEEMASTKPQRIQFDEGSFGTVKTPDTQSPQQKRNIANTPSSQQSPPTTRTTRTGGNNADPSADVSSCLRSLSSAQSACNINQASSFQSQLSSGQGGFGGTNAATAGVQNVNNIVLNCSNSQSICASTCGDSLDSWQNQCGSDCSSSIQSAVRQLGSAKSSCDGLSNNVQFLSSAANDSLNTASQHLAKNELNPASASAQLPYQAQNQIQPPSVRGPAGVNCEDPAYSSSYECSAIGQALAKEKAQDGFVESSSSNASKFSGIDSRREMGSLERKPQANGNAGGAKVSPIPNGGGALPSSESSNSHPQGNSAKGTPAPGDSITDIDEGFRSGGYSPDYGDSGQNKSDNFLPKGSKSGAEPGGKGFSLWSYLNRSAGEVIGKIATAFSVSEPKRELILTQPGRLGNDGELYSDEMPSFSTKTHGISTMIFLAVCGSVFGVFLWRFRREGKKYQAAKADFERRQTERRNAVDRRIQPTVEREPHLERRSSQRNRRAHEQRSSEQRRADVIDRRSPSEEVTLITEPELERRKIPKIDRRVRAEYDSAIIAVSRKQRVAQKAG